MQKKLEAVELKQDEDNKSLIAMQLQMEELTKANKNHTKLLKDVNETLGDMKAKSLNAEQFPDLLTSNPPQKFLDMITKHVQPTIKPIVNTEMSERDQIDEIKHNLMISGMAHNATPEADIEKFTQLVKDEMDLIVEIESAARIDRKEVNEKPKLLRVVFKSMKMRKAVLSKAVTLRQSLNDHVKKDIYIRPELTKKQLEESKNLNTQLRAIRNDNPTKKYKIYRGEIIELTPPTIPIQQD